MQFATDVRDGMNNQIETVIGASPTLEIRTGAKPANCAAADSGTLIASGTLPADWMAASASGTVGKNGSWVATGLPAAGAGTAGGHFRIKASGVCKAQGTFGVGQEMVPDNNNIADTQTVTVVTFNYTEGNG
jgi:hypothetical protein